MSIRLKHEGLNSKPPYESCCFCKTPTPYWYDTTNLKFDVPVCLICSSKYKVADLPTKDEWLRSSNVKNE